MAITKKKFIVTILLLVPTAAVSFACAQISSNLPPNYNSSTIKNSSYTDDVSARSSSTVVETSTFLCSSSSSSSSQQGINENNNIMTIPKWYQHEISITAPSRGCHLITSDVNKAIRDDLASIKIGMANLFIQHTSASLTINENADPDVRRDMEVALNKIVPGSWTRDGTFHHTMEGEDDMPGHVKASLMGPSLNIPIRNGRLALGTWQGIYLNEHRDQGGWGGGHTRRIIITLQGQS